jgi:hypothetical protein
VWESDGMAMEMELDIRRGLLIQRIVKFELMSSSIDASPELLYLFLF